MYNYDDDAALLRSKRNHPSNAQLYSRFQENTILTTPDRKEWTVITDDEDEPGN